LSCQLENRIGVWGGREERGGEAKVWGKRFQNRTEGYRGDRNLGIDNEEKKENGLSEMEIARRERKQTGRLTGKSPGGGYLSKKGSGKIRAREKGWPAEIRIELGTHMKYEHTNLGTSLLGSAAGISREVSSDEGGGQDGKGE